jgi:hypothetical protein
MILRTIVLGRRSPIAGWSLLESVSYFCDTDDLLADRGSIGASFLPLPRIDRWLPATSHLLTAHVWTFAVLCWTIGGIRREPYHLSPQRMLASQCLGSDHI